MKRLIYLGLFLLILTGCNASDKSGQSDSADSLVYRRDNISGSAVEIFETIPDTPSLYARVAPVMTRQQLASLDTLVVQGSVSGAVLGYAAPADTAALNRLMACPPIAQALGEDVRLLWGAATEHFGNTDVIPLYALTLTDGRPAMSGHIISSASVEYSSYSDACYLSLTMTPQASEQFASLTERNLGKPLAIVINDRVFMAPIVQDRIEDGRLQVSGNQSRKQLIALIDSL